jgi:hypothetical protein
MIESVTAALAFTPASEVSPDTERAGMLRAKTHPIDADSQRIFEFHDCRVHDWAVAGKPLHLDKMGFDTADLSSMDELQQTLATVRAAALISKADAASIRRSLNGKTILLSSGQKLKLLSIAPEGLIMRKSGPNGMKADPAESMSEMNGHEAAVAIHSDQDVRGTPLRQIMRGLAPWIFRHQAPDSSNRLSPLCLVNIWIPLQQINRPLTLMDRQTLDKRKHQLRYALPTDSFLDRDASQQQNDIWSFLYDEKQQWYFSAEMDSRTAYVFDTLGTPHGSMILPGEEVAEQYYRRLAAALDAIAVADLPRLKALGADVEIPLPGDTTLPLRQAINDMLELLQQLQHSAAHIINDSSDWRQRAAVLMDKLVRKSVEMRVVAVRVPTLFGRRSQ